MGATVSIALLTWFASSLVEWRMGRKSEKLHEFLVNPFWGFIISLALGFGMGAAGGAGVGIGVTVGNMLGLATNEFTYNFFETSWKAWESAKSVGSAAKAKVSSSKEFYYRNERICSEAVGTLRAGVMTIGAILALVIMIIGLPYRMITKFQSWRGSPTS